MDKVKVSPRYKITLPKNIREKLKPGQELQIFSIGSHIVLMPEIDIEDAKGMFKGITYDIDRRKEDRF